MPVPYVTAYDGEHVTYQLTLVADETATDGIRMSYADETATDRMFGVLWHRHGMTRTGRPMWRLVNTLRQRRCMLRSLCQVCGKTAVDGDTGRIWWLLPEAPGRCPDGGWYTNTPPTCAACVPVARNHCPQLRKWSRLCTVSEAEPYGVVAEVFTPISGTLASVDAATELPLDAFRKLEMALAKQLVVSLDDLRPA
ncbi:hypothetical protein SAMN05421811_103137 [Nonomuraea wenchangensis]|uniref:Uncharacterized protein n=1 Tax=Nonomuraea wenchangensis TaxID=568860 RepID=A0A1I0EQ96_9ACTN|nr:hypothetical protein SAMN05421811_103137 [Nonomuraea wenchangensis]